METGRVTSALLPGKIQPDAGGSELQYGDLAVEGAPPGEGDRVRFNRDPNNSGWAIDVQVISALMLAPTASAIEGLNLSSDQLRQTFALPGFAADTTIATARAAVEQAGAPAFVVRQNKSFYVVPAKAVASAKHQASAPLHSIVNAHGQLIHAETSTGDGAPIVPEGELKQFNASVDLARNSKLWGQMFDTATSLRCTLNHLHVYRADSGYENCPRDGAPLEPVEA